MKTRRSRQVDAVVWRDIPVTAAAWTLVDLASESSDDELKRACHEAGAPPGSSRPGRGRTRPPSERIRRAQASADRPRRLPGYLEPAREAVVLLLRHAGLPPPQTNRLTGAHYVDCRWPEHRLTVELDSYRFHNSRRAWEQDRRRERAAYARHDRFRRYPWGDVFEAPPQMLAELTSLLAE